MALHKRLLHCVGRVTQPVVELRVDEPPPLVVEDALGDTVVLGPLGIDRAIEVEEEPRVRVEVEPLVVIFARLEVLDNVAHVLRRVDLDERRQYEEHHRLADAVSPQEGGEAQTLEVVQRGSNITSLSGRIQTLENGGGGGSGSVDLGPLEDSVEAPDTRVGGNSSNITNLSGRIQTLENGGGRDSVDLGPLEDSVSALDSRVGGNTTRIQQLDTDIMRVASRTLTLENKVGNNSSTIQQLNVLPDLVDQLQKTVDRHGTDIINTANAVGKTIIDLKSLQELTQNLNNLYTNTATNVQSVITQQNLIRNRVLALEQAPKTTYYKSQELRLNQYQNGQFLLFMHPMNYDPLRVVMKARDRYTGFIYTVNPGSDYGFNYRHKPGDTFNSYRTIEVAIGSVGLFLMTNGGSRRNILTGQRRNRFSIYAVMEFVPSIPQLSLEILPWDPYEDDSLDY